MNFPIIHHRRNIPQTSFRSYDSTAHRLLVAVTCFQDKIQFSHLSIKMLLTWVLYPHSSCVSMCTSWILWWGLEGEEEVRSRHVYVYGCMYEVFSKPSLTPGTMEIGRANSETIFFLCPWDSPGKSTGVGLPCSLSGDLPDPGIKPVSVSCLGRWVVYHQLLCKTSNIIKNFRCRGLHISIHLNAVRIESSGKYFLSILIL